MKSITNVLPMKIDYAVLYFHIQNHLSTELSNHGPSQSGPYSRVRDSLAIFTLDFSLIAINKEFLFLL